MADAPPLVFADCETTGLDSVRHEIYEVALTKTDDTGAILGDLSYWIEPVRMHVADAGALRIGRYYERMPISGSESNVRYTGGRVRPDTRYSAALSIGMFTEGCHIVGARPEFDAGFIAAFLREQNLAPAWHHRLIDVESLAIGLVVGEDETWGRPQSLSNICEALGISRPGAHTARADCQQMRTAYFMLMEMAEQRDRLWHLSEEAKASV